MLKAEQVPETVAHVAEAAWSKDATWQQIIAAAINAWPGMQHCRWNELNAAFSSHLILPLPTAKPNTTS